MRLQLHCSIASQFDRGGTGVRDQSNDARFVTTESARGLRKREGYKSVLGAVQSEQASMFPTCFWDGAMQLSSLIRVEAFFDVGEPRSQSAN